MKRLFGHKLLAKRELAKLKETTKTEGKEKSENSGKDSENEGSDEDAKLEAKRALSNERLAILCAVFHPTQPWLITSGADGQIALFSY